MAARKQTYTFRLLITFGEAFDKFKKNVSLIPSGIIIMIPVLQWNTGDLKIKITYI